MNDRIPLKDCPFCGGRPMEFIEDSYHVIVCNFGRKGAHYAGCKARMQRKLVPSSSWEDRVIENREAWNNRFGQDGGFALDQIHLKLRDIHQRRSTLGLVVEKEIAKLVCEAANKSERTFSQLLEESTADDKKRLQGLYDELIQRYGQELISRENFLNSLKDRLIGF